jgi:hypothetical protein
MNELGTLTFTIPIDMTGGTKTIQQQYLYDYEYNPSTGSTSFSYIGIGSSRLSELKKYGNTGYTQDLVFSSKTENNATINYTGYTFIYTINSATTTLQYFDRSDGYTEIMGSTEGFTQEEVINYMLTREEHFLGFVEQPRVYSDIFVSRGKQGVLENNLRLGEIDNVGELSIYGNKYFNIKKQ